MFLALGEASLNGERDPPPSQAPPQPRPRVHFNPEKSLSAKLFGIDFGNAFGRPFRRGSGVTPLRGYFKTSAGIFAAGHFAKPWVRVFVTTIFAVAGTPERTRSEKAADSNEVQRK